MKPIGRILPPRLPAAVLGLVLGLALAPAAAQRAVAGNDDDQTRRFFALPLPRGASERAESVLDHLEAERIGQALGELQRLFEDSRGHLLPGAYRDEDAEPSIYATYPGAAAWARRVLLAADASVQERYRERYEGPAQDALASAREALDPDALVEVARRWPLTRSAESAWWALGDLEAERGAIELAAVAWSRAAELVSARDGNPPAGAGARRALVERLAAPSETRGAGGRYGDSAILDSDVPRADADRWLTPLDLEPFGDPRRTSGYPVQPLLAGEHVVVNSSLRVFSLDAYTGNVRWQSTPHPAWNSVPARELDEYFEKIDQENVLIGAAQSQGVVVAAMQIPYTEFPDSSWQGIPIFSRIPERRLMAFDAETGARLWDHVPEMEWNSATRGYELLAGNSMEQLSIVAAPPVIAASRVLVPLYRLQSRIEYSVTCFELETGELLWSTAVISGQRERNMFGRAATEFVAAPLVVTGDTVIAQTELGSVSALDLLSGELRWSSEYAQIPIRKNTSYSAPRRMNVWRTAPPAVVDDLVVAAPSDSSVLLCLELDDGAVRWSFGAYDLQRLGPSESQRYDLDLLVGADQDTVYLGGEKLVALQKQGGLRSRLSFSPRWEVLVDRSANDAPRPLLTPEVVVVPKRDERLTIDRRTGERVSLLSGEWQSQDRGSLALGDGVLYSLGRYGLVGLFDWETLVRRQRSRLADAPDDPQVHMDTAALFLRRGRALRERDGETNAARRFLSEARELLEPRVERAASPEDLLAEDRDAARLMHRLLREEALVLADLVRSDEATERLRAALALAPDRAAVRDTLLQEEALVRRLDGARRLAVLDELEARSGDLPMAPSQLEQPPAWLIGEALLTDEELENWQEAEPPIELWVQLSRADELARRHQGEEALVALHEAAATYGDLRLNEDWTVQDVVHARVGRRIEIDGPEVYARFETEAARMLDDALAAEDEAALARLAERYPYARAARRAEESLLETSYRARNAKQVAALTQVLVEREGVDDALTRDALIRLGLLLEARGNRGFLAGLLEREARRDPTASIEVSGVRGQPLAELTAEHPPREETSPRPSFGADAVYLRHESGEHEPLGTLVTRDVGDAPVRLEPFVVADRRIVAYDVTEPERPAWTYNVPYGINPQTAAIDEGHLLVGSRSMVRALDSNRQLVWQRNLGEDDVEALIAGQGVVLALVGPNRSEHRLVAWDSRDGVPLWEVELAEHVPGAYQGWLPPLVAEGRAVVFRRRFTENSTALLIDLYRGRVDAVVDLGPYGSKDVLNECAWVEDGRLCVPRFEQRGEMGSTLGIYDLDDGEELWRMDFPEDELFYAVARYEGRSYLVIHPSALRRGESRGAVYALDLEMKRIRALEGVRTGELTAGLEEGRTTTLEAPYLYFVPGEGGSRELKLRVLDLVSGRSTNVRLPVTQDQFYPEALPRPVVGTDHIALAFRVQHPDTQLVALTRLELVPLGEDGQPASSTVGGQALAGADGSLQPVQLVGFGDVLYVLHGNADGKARMDVYGRR